MTRATQPLPVPLSPSNITVDRSLATSVAGRLAQSRVAQALEVVADRAQQGRVVIHEQQRVSHAATPFLRPRDPRAPSARPARVSSRTACLPRPRRRAVPGGADLQ